jgi:hypothetical protein
MASTVNWNPNRYGSTKKVLSYNSATGNYSVVDQDHSYTGTNYNFASLPAAGSTTGTTTGTTTKTTGTTQDQTTQAFGDVRPWWLKQQGEGGGSGGVFSGYQEKEPVTELSGFFDPLRKASAGQKPPLADRLRHQAADFTGQTNREWADVDRALAGEEEPSKFKQTISDFGSSIKTKTKSLLDKIPIMPGMTALQAINKVLRPGANKSFRGVGGLYSKEISLMTTYGSTGATEMNPTGDSRKDDAGFNIVSMSGNYNKIGTNSRRHNMLKVADNIIDPIERKKKRNEIRKDWEDEKENGENKNYNIDSSGSADKAPSGNGAQSSVSRSTTASQAAGMGGGSRQATSAGSTKSGRSDGGWGW